MATQHNYYEELCALVISGQIAPDQLESLRQHMETCAGCLSTFADFGHVAGQLFEFAGKRMPLDPPVGMTARFIARAHSEGIPLAKKVDDRENQTKWLRNSVYALAATLLLFASLNILRLVQRSVMRRAALESPAGAVTSDATHADLLHHNANLAIQLDVLRKRVSTLAGDLNAKEQAIEAARSEKVQVSSRLVELEKDDQTLHQKIADRDTRITDLTAEAARSKEQVSQLLSAKSADEFRLQQDRSELSDLRTRVASLNEEIDDNQQLSAAAEEAKDLIVARKLHIVDVDDTDGSGRRQRPFGRIFYAEGRKLVFYAYDLADSRKLSAKINFYLWGSREGANKPVHSLGIFRTDDAKEARWVVNFDDPAVLAQINCVFVTAESNKRPVTEPTGHQLLFASLGPKANHP